MDIEKSKLNYIKVRDGFSNLIQEFKPGCEKCEDGIIRIKEEGSLGYKTQYCDCHKDTNLLNKALVNIKDCGISLKMMKRYLFEEYKEEFADIEACIKYITERDFKNWIYIFGTHGTGKTYSALMISYILIGGGFQVYYISVPSLFDNMRPNGTQQERDLLKHCKEVEVLVLDDIGQEKSTQWTLERLYLLLEDRRINGRPTIFTSNYSIEDLNKNIDNKAIISRIQGESAPIEMSGKDKRQS